MLWLRRFYPLLLCAAVLCGAAAAAERPASGPAAGPVRSLADLNGRRLGVLAGTMLDTAANAALDFTNIVYYDDTEAEIAALLAGEIDAFVEDEPVARFLAASDPRLHRVPGILQPDEYAFAMRFGDDTLYVRLDAALDALLMDGTVARLEEKWLDSTDEARRVMPEPAADQPLHVIRFGVSPVSAPFVYRNSAGEVIGLDLELMDLIAARIGRRMVPVVMEFSELVPALLSGRVDVIGSCFSITPERSRIVRFTAAYHEGGVAVVTLSENADR